MNLYSILLSYRQTALNTLASINTDAQSPAAKLLASEAKKGPDRDLTKLINLPFLHLGR